MSTELTPKVAVFFVGVGKCGTSWLYEFVKRHDLLSVPSLKEPYLIDEAPNKQAEIIKKLYARKDNMADLSTLYYWDPDNAQKIYDYNPHARIIITTRKPSHRITSHFGFLKRNGIVSEENVAAYLAGGDPEAIVARSSYADMINRYTAVFGADQVLVLPLEQLQQAPQIYVDRLCDSIGADRVTLTPEDTKPVLRSARARSFLAARIGKYAAGTLRSLGLLSFLGRCKSSAFIRYILFKEIEQDVTVNFGPRTKEISDLDQAYRMLLTDLDIEHT